MIKQRHPESAEDIIHGMTVGLGHMKVVEESGTAVSGEFMDGRNTQPRWFMKTPQRPCSLATVVSRPACSCEIAEWPSCFRAIHGIASSSSVPWEWSPRG